jgi:hypothetical protein
MVPSDNLKFHF